MSVLWHFCGYWTFCRVRGKRQSHLTCHTNRPMWEAGYVTTSATPILAMWRHTLRISAAIKKYQYKWNNFKILYCFKPQPCSSQLTYLLLTWEENWKHNPTFSNANCSDKESTVVRPRGKLPHKRPGWRCLGCIVCCVLYHVPAPLACVSPHCLPHSEYRGEDCAWLR